MTITKVQLSLNWIRGQTTPERDLTTDVATDSDGGVYVAGITRGSLFAQETDAVDETFVAHYDADGTLQWDDQIAGETTAADVKVNDAGEAFALVSTRGEIPGANLSNVISDEPGTIGIQDLALIKYDDAGQRLYAEQFGSSDLDNANAMAFAPNGDLIVVGTSRGPVTETGVEGSRSDISVWRFADTGEGFSLTWSTSIGAEIDSENAAGETGDRPTAVAVDPETGRIIVTGKTEGEYDQVSIRGGDAEPSPDHAGDGRLVNLTLSSEGELLQTRQYGFSNRDEVNTVLADGTGSYVIGGDGRPENFTNSDGF
jgi:hypothetical protein